MNANPLLEAPAVARRRGLTPNSAHPNGGRRLKPGNAQRGVTLIELCVGLALVGILFGFGIPSLRDWMQNAQIRAMADSVRDGLQTARAVAVQRNGDIRFQLVNSLAADCAVSPDGPHWVVSVNDAQGRCDQAPADPPPPPEPMDAANPYLIRQGAAAEGTANARIAAGQAAIVFSGLGRVTPPPGGRINIDITNPAGGACLQDGGPMRCLRIVVSVGGQIRVCEPGLSADPRACS